MSGKTKFGKIKRGHVETVRTIRVTRGSLRSLLLGID